MREAPREVPREPERRMGTVTAPVVDRPQYTWQDFELEDELPRAQPNAPDTPYLGDGLRHCGPLETHPAPPVGLPAGVRRPRRSCGPWRASPGCPTC